MSPYDNISMRCTNMEIQMETASWENGSCVTKTGRLGYVYAGAKTLLAKQVWMGCEYEFLNGLLQRDCNWCTMMTVPLLAWIQKLTVQHFTLDVENLFNKPKTFTPVCRWLLVMVSHTIPLHMFKRTQWEATDCWKAGIWHSTEMPSCQLQFIFYFWNFFAKIQTKTFKNK